MKLDDDQQIIVDELIQRYESKNFNTSQLLPAATGLGKSFCTIHVLKHFPTLQPFIICTKNTITMWENLCKQHNITPLAIMTYNKLSGGKNGQCDHQYLIRKDKEFRVTKKWKELKGVFIVCDESQALKNKTSLRHWALYTLLENNKRDKMLCLTASPIDKKTHWVSLYRQLGLVHHKVMVKREGVHTHYDDYGLGDVFHATPDKWLKRVHNRFDIKAKNVNDILMYLWNKFFRQKLVIPVVDPVYHHPITGVKLNKTIKNYFATMDCQDKNMLQHAIQELKQVGVIQKDDDVDIDLVNGNFCKVQLALMRLCRAKLNTVVRLSLNKLQKTTNKVIIACPFVEDQHILVKMLGDYHPLLLNGKTKDRDTLVELFNQPNDHHRVLIMSNELGEGISLHDLDGGYPRTMYIIPSYHFLKMFQCSGRTYRRGMMSDTEVVIIYANDGVVESILINALAKTDIASMVLWPGSGRVYPGDYPYEIEECQNKEELKTKLECERQKVKK